MLENLNKYKILLGSKSPRRRELMQLLDIPFTQIGLGDVKEDYPSALPAASVPLYLANLKADAYKLRLMPVDLLITADTIVLLDDVIYGKPANKDEACEMLMKLSGRTHQVITGVAVTTEKERKSFETVSHVTFSTLSKEDIEYYVNGYSPLDKAGAYGIQEWIGGVAVEKIEGSFYNVMGLPVHALYNMLRQID